MSAELVSDHSGGDDPVEILRVLPESWHAQFLDEYHAALDAAHEIRRWGALRELLHLWRLRSVAYSNPEFEQSAWTASRATAGSGTAIVGRP